MLLWLVVVSVLSSNGPVVALCLLWLIGWSLFVVNLSPHRLVLFVIVDPVSLLQGCRESLWTFLWFVAVEPFSSHAFDRAMGRHFGLFFGTGGASQESRVVCNKSCVKLMHMNVADASRDLSSFGFGASSFIVSFLAHERAMGVVRLDHFS